MAERIPQSVAYLVVFRAFLASDGKTPATGKTIAITLSKNGATSFSNPAAGATNATEMASGFYKFTLGTGDTDTLGPLAWRGAEGTINDAGDVLSIVDDYANIAAIKAKTDNLPSDPADASVIAGILGTPAGASVSADIAAVKSDSAAILIDTDELQTDWTNGGRLDLILDIIAADTTTDIPALIAALAAFVDTEVAAIKAKTDSLTFTVPGQVDANLQAVNDVALVGDGSATPWGPA